MSFPTKTKKILLVGYNGANNTGAEARLLAIIEDIRAVMGDETLITVPTLFEENLCRYITEGPYLHIVSIPSIFFLAFRRLVREHDLVMLVEGSCYMDTWSSYLFLAWLWVTRCAREMGKRVIAYAVDSGTLNRFNQWRLRREAGKTDLIITRTGAAAERIRAWGVNAPLKVTADTAFGFCTEPADKGLLTRVWPEAGTGVVGLAAVDFYQWPVVARLWGKRENCYRWPYYFKDSRARRKAREELALKYAAFADRMHEKYNRPIALLCMEQLDESLARRIYAYIKNCGRVCIFSSRDYNASQMTVILRSLDLLVTSRYHAGVLSLPATVPQVAVGHDMRLQDFYRDLKIYDDYFIDYRNPDLFTKLTEKADTLLADASVQREKLLFGYWNYLGKAAQNRELLREVVD